jgi:hypothetical protein
MTALRGCWRRPAAVALLAAAVAAGCSRASEPDPGDRWAAEVIDRHREADRRLDEGDAAGARAALLALVAEGAPAAASDASGDRRLALQDTYFRLARLSLGDRDGRQALAYVDAGLALGSAPHLFVANLLVARGAANEALGDGRAAAADYHRAQMMNEALLQEALSPR